MPGEGALTVPPEVLAALRPRFETIEHDWREHRSRVAAIAAKHRVLPLLLTMGGFAAIRADGAFVSVEWETEKIQPERDVRKRDCAIVGGLGVYPELRPLVPQRAVDSPACPQCQGGTHKNPALRGLVGDCVCAGLGFIPESWHSKRR